MNTLTMICSEHGEQKMHGFSLDTDLPRVLFEVQLKCGCVYGMSPNLHDEMPHMDWKYEKSEPVEGATSPQFKAFNMARILREQSEREQ